MIHLNTYIIFEIIFHCRLLQDIGASLVAQLVKNLPAVQETLVRFLGWEDPLKKRYGTHSGILGLPLCLSC